MKEVDGYKWTWDGLWRLVKNKYYEVFFIDSRWKLTTDDPDVEYIGENLEEVLKVGVENFKKQKKFDILNRMTDMMETADRLNNDRYIEMLDFIYTDVAGREGGLTENEIILLNEINGKMAVL